MFWEGSTVSFRYNISTNFVWPDTLTSEVRLERVLVVTSKIEDTTVPYISWGCIYQSCYILTHEPRKEVDHEVEVTISLMFGPEETNIQ